MLRVGTFRARDCGRLSRRAFVQAGLAAPFMVGLPGALAGTVRAASFARAKSILLVFLGGGPSHLDMFDPKPLAPAEYRGPLATIATRTPGVRYTELLPRMAANSHRYSLIRTNVNYDGDHLKAESIALTGRTELAPDLYPPNFGSILARHRASHGLPPFVSLARGPIGDGRGPMTGYGGGTWGKAYDPFLVSCSEEGRVEIPELQLLEGLTPDRLADRGALRAELDGVRRAADATNQATWDSQYRQAHELLVAGETLAAFDLARESDRTREAYGHTSFGQSCLLGRRLVEAGVPYVQVNWSQYVEVYYPFSDYGWDTHADNFSLLADWHCPLLDRVFVTLLDDLESRGLLATTLLVCMGEFGRTPRINAIGSRDHWHPCYFSIWAGAGIEPGRVIGQSDPRGEHPATDPVTPAMVGTTMLHLAGVDSQARASLRVLEGGHLIDGLL
jgi:uncharacterized protein (DUF1501 family)